MRLHQLEVVAFGPFAEPARVDFDALSDAGLFLLLARLYVRLIHRLRVRRDDPTAPLLRGAPLRRGARGRRTPRRGRRR